MLPKCVITDVYVYDKWQLIFIFINVLKVVNISL